MGFNEDLLATVRLMYQYCDVVCGRHTLEIGEIHDMRVSNILRHSQTLQGSLRNLKKHFPQELHTSFDSVDKMAGYLHRSFNAAINYRQPYSNANPFGPSIDATYFTDAPVRAEFETGLIELTSMISMEILLVHMFVLQFTLAMCAFADALVDDGPLIDIPTKLHFQKLIREIHRFMTGSTDHDGAGGAAASALSSLSEVSWARGTDIAEKLHQATFRDFQLSDEEALPAFMTETNPHGVHVLRLHRMLYYTCVLWILEILQSDDLTATPEQILLKTARFSNFWKRSAVVVHRFRTHFEEYNMRESLKNKFLGHTKDVVYKYATLMYPTSDGGANQAVIQNVNGQVNVVPRKRVHVYKRASKWEHDTDENWRTFAFVHGEASLMSDIIRNITPLCFAIRQYFMEDVFPTQWVHLMLTRFLGDDLTFIDKTHNCDPFQTLLTRFQGLRLKEPNEPSAISIQPAPNSIKKWTVDVIQTYDNGIQYMKIPSNAKYHRPTSLNLNDLLKKSNVQADQYNVVWNRVMMLQRMLDFNDCYAVNSMFLLHYGKALVSLPTPSVMHPQHVFGSDNLTLRRTIWSQYNVVIPHRMDASGHPIQYPSARNVQHIIQQEMSEFEKLFKARSPGFLHPASWLLSDEIHNSRWEQCDESFELNKGTVLTFNPLLGDPALHHRTDTDGLTEDIVTVIYRDNQLPTRTKPVPNDLEERGPRLKLHGSGGGGDDGGPPGLRGAGSQQAGDGEAPDHARRRLPKEAAEERLRLYERRGVPQRRTGVFPEMRVDPEVRRQHEAEMERAAAAFAAKRAEEPQAAGQDSRTAVRPSSSPAGGQGQGGAAAAAAGTAVRPGSTTGRDPAAAATAAVTAAMAAADSGPMSARTARRDPVEEIDGLRPGGTAGPALGPRPSTATAPGINPPKPTGTPDTATLDVLRLMYYTFDASNDRRYYPDPSTQPDRPANVPEKAVFDNRPNVKEWIIINFNGSRQVWDQNGVAKSS